MRSCHACYSALPSDARYCRRCGAPQAATVGAFAQGATVPTGAATVPMGAAYAPPPPPPRPSVPATAGSGSNASAGLQAALRRLGSSSGPDPRLALAGAASMGVLVFLAALWLGVARLLPGSGDGGPVAVLEPTGSGIYDVYLVDDVPDPGDLLSRDDLYLKDVAIGGYFVGTGGDRELVSYESFDLDVDGRPLFAYQEEGDNDWNLAVVDGDRPRVIQSFDSAPLVYRIDGETFVLDQGDGSSCAVYALDGLTTNRIERAGFCDVNVERQLVLMADADSSGIDIWLRPLDGGERRDLVTIDPGSTFSARYSVSGDSVLISELDSDGLGGDAGLYDTGSGELRAEATLRGVAATDHGFFGLDDDNDGRSTIVYVDGDGAREIAAADDVSSVSLSPDGSTLLVVADDGSDVVVSTAPVGDEGAGDLTEVDVLDSPGSARFLNDRDLLLTSGGSVRVKRGDQAAVEVGDVGGGGGNTYAPSVFELGRLAVVTSPGDDGTAIAVVRSDGEPALAEVRGLSQLDDVATSAGGDWWALWGAGDGGSGRDTLVLLNTRTLEMEEVDQADNIAGAQFDGKYLYYTTTGSDIDEVETFRFEIGGRGVAESVTDGSRLLLPGAGTSGLHRSTGVEFATVS